MTRTFALAAGLAALSGCGSSNPPEPKSTEAPKSAPKPTPPADETARFPAKNRVEVKQLAGPLFDKAILPGGNVAHYKQGKKEWDLWLVKSANPQDAALLLLDYKKQMQDSHFVAHFGGYAGKDNERTAFVFTKGRWLAGVSGLPEKEADMLAREFAALLN